MTSLRRSFCICKRGFMENIKKVAQVIAEKDTKEKTFGEWYYTELTPAVIEFNSVVGGVFVGIRQAGKSYLLFQQAQKKLKEEISKLNTPLSIIHRTTGVNSV